MTVLASQVCWEGLGVWDPRLREVRVWLAVWACYWVANHLLGLALLELDLLRLVPHGWLSHLLSKS